MSTAQASPQTSAIEEGTARRAPMRLSNVEMVRLEYAAVRRRDLDEVLERLDPDIEWCEPAGVLPPPAGGGIRHGRRAVEKGVFETLTDYHTHTAELARALVQQPVRGR